MEKHAMKDFKHIWKSSCNFGGNLKPNYTSLSKSEGTMQIQCQIKWLLDEFA